MDYSGLHQTAQRFLEQREFLDTKDLRIGPFRLGMKRKFENDLDIYVCADGNEKVSIWASNPTQYESTCLIATTGSETAFSEIIEALIRAFTVIQKHKDLVSQSWCDQAESRVKM